MHKGFDDLDAPSRWHAPAFLPPLHSRTFLRAQIGGGVIDKLPCERCIRHEKIIGQIVQSVKDNVSHAFYGNRRQNGEMAKKDSLTDWQVAFIERTKNAREHRFEAAKQMAKALGIDPPTYAKYEFRSPLPHKYVEQFCLIAGVSIEWLFTGEERRRA